MQLGKGLSILPVQNKQTVVSSEFWEFSSMTGTIETVFASSNARCDAIWEIYNTFTAIRIHQDYLQKLTTRGHKSFKRLTLQECKTSFEKRITMQQKSGRVYIEKNQEKKLWR